MELLCNDVDEVYVWVDNNDHQVKLSPHFDYVEDAIRWRDLYDAKITGTKT